MAKKKKLKAEIAGWYGIIAILVAYILVSFEAVTANGVAFQLLNLTGAIGIIIISIHKDIKQLVVLNTFWAVVAIFSLTRLMLAI